MTPCSPYPEKKSIETKNDRRYTGISSGFLPRKPLLFLWKLFFNDYWLYREKKVLLHVKKEFNQLLINNLNYE